MSKIVPVVGVVVVAVAGYFGLIAAGIIGGPPVPTDEEVTAGLAAYADEINTEEGVRFDGFSHLVRATAMNKVITIRGESMLDMADLSENYYESRVNQGLNVVCTDETLRALLRGRATMHFNWFSADGERIGDMISVRGDEECARFDA